MDVCAKHHNYKNIEKSLNFKFSTILYPTHYLLYYINKNNFVIYIICVFTHTAYFPLIFINNPHLSTIKKCGKLSNLDYFTT